MKQADHCLLFKLHQSGVSNERMSLEIALGLASLTRRRLILYGAADNSFGIRPSKGGWYRMENHGWLGVGRSLPSYRPSLVTELYEQLPVQVYFGRENPEWPESWFSGVGKEIHVFNHQIAGWWCCPPALDDSYSLASIVETSARAGFADGRSLLRIPSEPIWRMQGSNLSYYSRFFFDPTNTVSIAMQRMQLCSWIESFAANVARSIGDFNGCHIRLTDFRKFLPQSSDYNEVIASVISESISPDQLLLIATDEDPGSSFFDPLRRRFGRILFLEDYLRSECGDLWASVPFINESVLGVICQLILERSSSFLGTIGSTFTGLIHRGWLSRRLADGAKPSESHFRFIHCGIAGAPVSIPGYFDKGQFIESLSGTFSWNRVSICNVSKGQLAWYREWPECALDRGFVNG